MAKKPTKPEPKKQPKGEDRLTLADLWDNTDPSEASNILSVGEHEVRINEMILKKDPKKGTAVFCEYEAIEGDEEGKKIRQMYKLTDAAGEKAPGLAFLKRDLALLGYDDVPGAKMEKVLKEISEEQPMVIVRVAENGQYTNAYLQGAAGNVGGKAGDDDEEVEVGDKVTWTDEDGDDHEGEVVKIKKDKATVKDDDDEEHKVELSELTKADEEDPKTKKKKGKKAEAEVEIEVGSKVKWVDDDGDDQTGEVTKIKGDKAKVKDDDDDIVEVDLSDLEIADEEEAEEEIAVGDKVKWQDDDGDDCEGEVTKIKGDKATVKDADDDTHKVDVTDLEKVED